MARPTLLIVDDDEDAVETLGDIFVAQGYAVATAGDGQAAVALVETGQYRVVLMDARMPGLNGVDALKRMRTTAPETRVIIMTAFTRDELMRDAQRLALAVLAKPLDFEELLPLVEAAMHEAA